MKTLYLILLALLLFAPHTSGQQNQAVETETHIFWHPDRKLTFEDFHGDGSANPDARKWLEEYGRGTSGYNGLWVEVDAPKKKKYIKKDKLLDKVYMVAAFEKTRSYMLIKDSMELKYAQLIFDVYEVSTRMARSEFSEFSTEAQKDMPVYGLAITTISSFENGAMDFKDEIVAGMLNDFYIAPDPEAYDEWREIVDNMLLSFEDFATSQDEYQRFATKKPVDPRYEGYGYVLLRENRNY